MTPSPKTEGKGIFSSLCEIGRDLNSFSSFVWDEVSDLFTSSLAANEPFAAELMDSLLGTALGISKDGALLKAGVLKLSAANLEAVSKELLLKYYWVNLPNVALAQPAAEVRHQVCREQVQVWRLHNCEGEGRTYLG